MDGPQALTLPIGILIAGLAAAWTFTAFLLGTMNRPQYMAWQFMIGGLVFFTLTLDALLNNHKYEVETPK